MKFITVVLLCIYFSSVTDGKSTKKFKDESAVLNKKLINKPKPLPPAIIAIEIVDPNEKENKTSKNSKRTIDSSLGYGYQSPPKYQVYKYSQHDIPPYRGPSNIFSGGIKTHHFDLQKSVSYNLPQHNTQSLERYYQPGTTLYSTVNHQGQVGGLSSNLPHENEPQVPVIILKVYPSQLNDPSAALHPNLPQSHPLASVVNSIDVQALLTKYVQSALTDQHQYQQQQQQYEPQYQYQQPAQDYQYQQPAQDYQYQQQVQGYQHQQPAQEYQYQYVQQQPDYHGYGGQNDDGLLTHENYPKETHTRVIFRTDKNQAGKSPPVETKTIHIAIPEGAYSAVQVETPDMQYGYATPNDGSAQQYYYQQQPDVAQNYYYQTVPDSGYQQVENQQQVGYAPPSQSSSGHETPYNYHTHQKRSKKTKFSRSRVGEKVDDVIKLQPIRA